MEIRQDTRVRRGSLDEKKNVHTDNKHPPRLIGVARKPRSLLHEAGGDLSLCLVSFPPRSPLYRNLVLALKLYCNPAVVFCLQQSLPDAVQNCATAVRKQPDRVLFTHAPLWNLAGNFEMKRAESDLPGWKRLSLHLTMYSCFFLLRGRNTVNDDTCKSQLTAEWLTYLSSRSSTN